MILNKWRNITKMKYLILFTLKINFMNYPRELKKYLAKKMAKVDANCMGADFNESYEYHLATESFELLEYYISYFGVYDGDDNIMQELHPLNILKKIN